MLEARIETTAVAVLTFPEAQWVLPKNGIVADIGIKACELVALRVFAQEPASHRVIESGTVVVQRSFGVEFPSGILKRIRQRARGTCLFTERVIAVDGSSCAGRFIDSSSEGVVFEANSSATSGQSHAGQPVFVVPCVIGGA